MISTLRILSLQIILIFSIGNLKAQDDFGIEDFSTKITVPIPMPDGTNLMTDIYLPVTSKDLSISVDIPLIGETTIDLIPSGTQLFYYPELNGQPNPNPWQLPLVFTRTPYNKEGDMTGRIVTLFGYSYALQDMRGRYSSEGVYFPMYSDSWAKAPYHPNYGHILDITDLNDPRNGNFHEDGYHSLQYLTHNLMREYDLNGDGNIDTVDLLANGSIGMFGASALGNTQYQAAAAYPIDPEGPGLKGLLAIVATNEHYKYTGFQNGVFRDRIVTGWLKGQIFSGTNDDLNDIDDSIDNAIHSSADYGLTNKFDAANMAIDHFSTVRYEGGPAGYYPNSIGRLDMDASRAMINENGVGDLNGTISRYTNKEVPTYHLTGWWDIFTDGQIETANLMRHYLSHDFGNRDKQKLVIGPWAHQTIGSRRTGDMFYKENVSDVMGIDIGDLDIDNLEVASVIGSELISWFRYTLNYNDYANIGEPMVRIPESNVWQGSSLGSVRVPSANFDFSFNELLNFLNGTGGLNGLAIEVDIPFIGIQSLVLDIPATGNPIIAELSGNEEIPEIGFVDFANDVPNVRMYVPGPIDDGISENENLGNYWLEADTFPFTNNIHWQNYYLHQNGTIDNSKPNHDEGFKIYVHNPDDPILTVGGANMIVRTPLGDRDSQGQMDLAKPEHAPYTMDRTGVVSFEMEITEDSLSIVGFPVMNLYAKSNPGGVTSGPTDTDFFIRVLDVYPDGREYFVVEGAVNARARDYARALVDNPEGELFPFQNDDIPFTNIQIGEIYEYRFGLMPIAYTWGKGHKMKILISSSNFTRYQVNPNLPIEENEFFRRKPSDGRSYVFNGQELMPRIAVQRIAFSPEHPTHIELPVYNTSFTSVNEILSSSKNDFDVMVFPNPVNDKTGIYSSYNGNVEAKLYNSLGQLADSWSFSHTDVRDFSKLDSGLYFLQITDRENNRTKTIKISKN
ncbi:MAG: CocE/NonD family hydrolase [Chitinophagaceae bacterium]|nr:MAG: CocE/NonD family hydrolase [Chitinophagaceae bacterium]